MSQTCKALHEKLETLPLVRWPFDVSALPRNGIYFLYEIGETWGHGGSRPRIVRIGTHKDGNFRSRVSEHFLVDEKKMDFDATKSPPHDRSIFRKNIGRALLNRANDPYLAVWEKDFTTRASREAGFKLRDIEKERSVEAEVTRILRENFSFRFIVVDNQTQRMGTDGLEASLIGTVAGCNECRVSPTWLGLSSPVQKIRESGMWLVQHAGAPPMNDADERLFTDALASTRIQFGPPALVHETA
ncbi:MAG: hypothetical protein HYS81_04745 [Candidatus Aenigmatarchaeota archaeon]|nr:MAG: hypothetical protein HYS81_04745 [Candidatus Aenigmarchaeota archaeon]